MLIYWGRSRSLHIALELINLILSFHQILLQRFLFILTSLIQPCESFDHDSGVSGCSNCASAFSHEFLDFLRVVYLRPVWFHWRDSSQFVNRVFGVSNCRNGSLSTVSSRAAPASRAAGVA